MRKDRDQRTPYHTSMRNEFSEFVRNEGPNLRRFARSFLPKYAKETEPVITGEDVVQEALLELLEENQEPIRNKSSYVKQKVAWRARDAARRQRHYGELVSPMPTMRDDDGNEHRRDFRDGKLGVEEEVIGRLAAERIRELAEKGLTPDQRTGVTLHAAGLSYREIADSTGWSISKVKMNIMRGRNRLRQLMGEERKREENPSQNVSREIDVKGWRKRH